MAYEAEKRAAAEKAVELVKDNMVVGIGTGSTAQEFIPLLIEHVKKQNLSISCVCTSTKSRALIKDSIPLIDEKLDTPIDITFDGADRIDQNTFYRIKGGGGALLREKIVANSSKQNIVLVDHTKVDTSLRGFPLAVEIVPFGYQSTIARIESLGYKGSLRMDPASEAPVASDNGNYTYDITFDGPIEDPPKHHESLKSLLGVIETGLFLSGATAVYIGSPDGSVKILERS